MSEHKIICFELNNWSCGRDYPNAEPFLSWMRNDLNIRFRNEEWVKENKLCVRATFLDMSQHFLITATEDWVEANCPNLLTDFQNFIRHPDEWGTVVDRFGNWFLDYSEENIGITWFDDPEW